MNITDFLKDPFFRLPIIQKTEEDYKALIDKGFNQFLEKLGRVDKFDDISKPISEIKKRQKHLVSELNAAISCYYAGKPAVAFSKFEKGLESSLKNFKEVLNVREFGSKSAFFRIRTGIHKNNYPLAREELFHIPFDLRGKIKTQRFSIPGFPSLYLGTSSYVCWEELSRPNLNDFQIVGLKNTNPLSVIDLSPPKDDDANKYYKFLMIWPLVYACSVRVRNDDDDFKPEYIIPQLLLQWVRRNNKIDGISYQTTHIDFNESLAKGEFLNIVLPVTDNKTKGLCSKLKAKFTMTESTSVELNECTTKGLIDGGGARQYNNEHIEEIELIKGSSTKYNPSIFGQLEEALLKMEYKEIK